MFSVEADQSKRLMVISYAQHVSSDEAKEAARQVRQMLESFEPGFRVLADLRWLVSMEAAAAPHIADIMTAIAGKKVATVVRVVPDPRKDIGLNILSLFHYGDNVKIVMCETLADALASLAAES
jgi:predicted site-specific integrase-resolvase